VRMKTGKVVLELPLGLHEVKAVLLAGVLVLVLRLGGKFLLIILAVLLLLDETVLVHTLGSHMQLLLESRSCFWDIIELILIVPRDLVISYFVKVIQRQRRVLGRMVRVALVLARVTRVVLVSRVVRVALVSRMVDERLGLLIPTIHTVAMAVVMLRVLVAPNPLGNRKVSSACQN